MLVGLGGLPATNDHRQPAGQVWSLVTALLSLNYIMSGHVRPEKYLSFYRREILIFQLVMGRLGRSVGISTISPSFSCNWTHFHGIEEQ